MHSQYYPWHGKWARNNSKGYGSFSFSRRSAGPFCLPWCAPSYLDQTLQASLAEASPQPGILREIQERALGLECVCVCVFSPQNWGCLQASDYLVPHKRVSKQIVDPLIYTKREEKYSIQVDDLKHGCWLVGSCEDSLLALQIFRLHWIGPCRWEDLWRFPTCRYKWERGGGMKAGPFSARVVIGHQQRTENSLRTPSHWNLFFVARRPCNHCICCVMAERCILWLSLHYNGSSQRSRGSSQRRSQRPQTPIAPIAVAP